MYSLISCQRHIALDDTPLMVAAGVGVYSQGESPGEPYGGILELAPTIREWTPISEIESLIGLKQVLAFHLNDSKTARGSRVDRHEHIGQGKIGLNAFRFIMRDRRFRKIPKVLETPKEKDLRQDVANMKTLRSLLDD